VKPAARLGLLAVALGAIACTPTFAGRLRTRDPYQEKKLAGYRSGTIVLAIGDVDVAGMDGRPLPMSQSAWFEIVSPDEIRFHLMLSSKWAEFARVEGFSVRLRTDRGVDLAPTSTWVRRKLVAEHQSTFASVRRGATAVSPATVTEETVSRDLHGANTVLVFRHPGVAGRGVRSYRLFLDGKKRRLRFIWDVVPKAELEDEE